MVQREEVLLDDETPIGWGRPDHGHVEAASLEHGFQGRQDLLVGQIPRCPDEQRSIRSGIVHRSPLAVTPGRPLESDAPSPPLRRRRNRSRPFRRSPTIPVCITYLLLDFRYRRIKLLVELSWPSGGSAGLSSSGMMRWASTLPNSTPHWSKESMSQMAPWVKTLCSYRATSLPSVSGVSRS